MFLALIESSKKIKNKYDEVEKYSAVLPPRKSSEKEMYLDKN
nr:MAG TPA: hypothetical protein [Caudoviricetes sp.]